jgi:hypothetical protein
MRKLILPLTSKEAIMVFIHYIFISLLIRSDDLIRCSKFFILCLSLLISSLKKLILFFVKVEINHKTNLLSSFFFISKPVMAKFYLINALISLHTCTFKLIIVKILIKLMVVNLIIYRRWIMLQVTIRLA